MTSTIKISLGESAAETQDFIESIVKNHADDFDDLIAARQSGELNEEEFEIEMNREMLMIEVELLTVTVIGKAALQKAIQTAISVALKIVQPL